MGNGKQSAGAVKQRCPAGPACTQVAVHLGMLDDARKLYASSERFDLLCRLYQVRLWLGLGDLCCGLAS